MQRSNNNKSNWSAPMRKGVRSVDISAVIYKYELKKNPYIRSSAYRKTMPKVSTLIGTNSEIY